MDLKLQRLSQGEQIAAGSSLALFACMFLGWFNFGFATSNAWETLHYISPYLTITIVSTLGVAFAKASNKSIGDIPGEAIVFYAGTAAAILILFRLIDPIYSGSAEAGLFLGLIAAVGIAVGGYLATGGEAFDRLKAMLASSSASPMPPPAAAAPPPSPAQAPVTPATPPPPPAQPPAAQASPPPPPASTLPAPPPVAPPPPVPAGVFCESCGAQVSAEDRFCTECGTPVSG